MRTNTYPKSFGPQGDILYVNNYVRAVRDVSLPTSIRDVSTNELKIYPNPATNSITIGNDKIIERVLIYSIQGIKVLELNPGVNTTQINSSGLTSGVYFISVINESGQTQTQKIVIRK